MASSPLARTALAAARSAVSGRRYLQTSAPRRAITNFEMPAMSPTMTEGGIASWKLKEGDSFTTGDVLLEIETDKATIDVEAQDDGIMGKILAPDGARGIPVGQVIALLAEEGDDISNLEAPKEQPKPKAEPAKAEAASPPPPPPSSAPSPPAANHGSKHIEHSRPLFPSVARLLLEHNVESPEKIKGTGVRGMLTKGDVLAFLGKASSPTGTYKEEKKKSEAPKKAEAKADKPLDSAAIRRLIVGSMYEASAKARAAAAPRLTADFDSLIADYLPSSAPPPSKAPVPPPTPKSRSDDFLDGLV